MSTEAITTIVRMMESLPKDLQERVVDHVREYLADIQDEQEWDAQFENSQAKLEELARRAREQIAAGKAEPMSYDRFDTA